MNVTLFVCSCCGKDLPFIQRQFMEEFGLTECANCHYLHTRGVYTIEQYNQYLRETGGGFPPARDKLQSCS